MTSSLSAVFARWDLLYMITWREIRIKYKQSVMGMAWAILMPLVIVSAGVVVRVGFSMLSGRQLDMASVASVGVRAVPWAFVVSGIRFGTNSLLANANLVTKIYMPREIFPLAAILSQLVDFGVAALVMVPVLALLRVGVSFQLLWLPLLMLLLIVQVTAMAILLSAGSLFLRDVKYLVEVGLTFAIFFTPVFYDSAMFGRYAPLLMLDPVAPILEGFADTVVKHTAPPLGWLAYSAGMAVLMLFGSLAAFRKLVPYFAEAV